jgi:hypothetical protein
MSDSAVQSEFRRMQILPVLELVVLPIAEFAELVGADEYVTE